MHAEQVPVNFPFHCDLDFLSYVNKQPKYWVGLENLILIFSFLDEANAKSTV